MLTFDGMIENVESSRNWKYDLPDWMKEEQMENCSGFVNDYYRGLIDRIKEHRAQKKAH